MYLFSYGHTPRMREGDTQGFSENLIFSCLRLYWQIDLSNRDESYKLTIGILLLPRI